MPINYRTPTDFVVIVGTFNKKWLLQFQNRKKYEREFFRDILGGYNPEVFDNLEEAFWTANHYELKVVDIRLHHCYSVHPEIDENMKEKINNMRKEFSGTYTKVIN